MDGIARGALFSQEIRHADALRMCNYRRRENQYVNTLRTTTLPHRRKIQSSTAPTLAGECCRTRSVLTDALFSCCLGYLHPLRRVEAARCLWTPASPSSSASSYSRCTKLHSAFRQGHRNICGFLGEIVHGAFQANQSRLQAIILVTQGLYLSAKAENLSVVIPRRGSDGNRSA
jgi:hypothetical protein